VIKKRLLFLLQPAIENFEEGKTKYKLFFNQPQRISKKERQNGEGPRNKKQRKRPARVYHV
jgi:hypothetical protein